MKYRIVLHEDGEYRVQYWRGWFSRWVTCGYDEITSYEIDWHEHRFTTLEQARAFVQTHAMTHGKKARFPRRVVQTLWADPKTGDLTNWDDLPERGASYAV